MMTTPKLRINGPIQLTSRKKADNQKVMVGGKDVIANLGTIISGFSLKLEAIEKKRSIKGNGGIWAQFLYHISNYSKGKNDYLW